MSGVHGARIVKPEAMVPTDGTHQWYPLSSIEVQRLLFVMDPLIGCELKVQAHGYRSYIQVFVCVVLFCFVLHVEYVFKPTTLTAQQVLRGNSSLSPALVYLPRMCHRYKQTGRYKSPCPLTEVVGASGLTHPVSI